LAFLEAPYEFLDKVVMKAYKPLIWYIVISWASPLGCSYILDNLLADFITSIDLTSEEQNTMCNDGVKMYWEQFFYGGPIGNQPYDLGWAWSP